MNIMLKKLILTSSAFAFMACSTEVDLCYGEHPHRSLVDFQFAWDEMYSNIQPDSMLIVADRPINSYRYVFRTTAKATGNKGVTLFPLSEIVDETIEDPPVAIPTTYASKKNSVMTMRSGNYQLVAFNADSKSFYFTGLDDFQNNAKVRLKDLSISYKSYARTDSLLTSYASWTDYNPYSSFVISNSIPIFYHYIDNLKVSISGENVTPQFTPMPITQKVKINFKVAKEKGVSVDSMIAEMSGIPSTIELSTRSLKIDKTYKMLFKPTAAVDNANLLVVDCTGIINVTGIIPSARKELTTGPGIMQVAVYTHAYDEQNKKRSKVIQVNINLFKTLTDARLVQWDNTNNYYKQRVREGVLDIKQILQIEKGQVVNSGDASTGLDFWIQTNRIDIDI